jgi:dienelactone hydrolase
MRHAVLPSLVCAVTALVMAAGTAAAQETPGPQGREEGPFRRQLWLIPIPGETMLMRAAVLRPPGAGPFPLAAINHGSSQNAERRAKYAMPVYRLASQWFLDRGFAVVLPQRPGHGETGGPYLEDQGRCESANYGAAGLATADSVQATIDYMTAQPFARKRGAVVVGQSAGGWGAIALASRNPELKGVINFAGGRGGGADNRPSSNCSPDRLVAAAGEFGRTARIPTLWLYAENDSYFAPQLSKRMVRAFVEAGGRAEYHLLPPIGEEGHRLIETDEARALWTPIVARFLAARP